MSYADLIPNVLILGLLALAVAKINEAVVGQLYAAAYSLFSVSAEWQERINTTRFLWALGLGVLLCVQAHIPFMGEQIPAPLSHVIAGLIVGSGAGVVWDLVLDPVPVNG